MLTKLQRRLHYVLPLGVREGHSHRSACEGLEVGLCNGRENESGKKPRKNKSITIVNANEVYKCNSGIGTINVPVRITVPLHYMLSKKNKKVFNLI